MLKGAGSGFVDLQNKRNAAPLAGSCCDSGNGLHRASRATGIHFDHGGVHSLLPERVQLPQGAHPTGSFVSNMFDKSGRQNVANSILM